jgi:uncharacterized protein (DUF608 family)
MHGFWKLAALAVLLFPAVACAATTGVQAYARQVKRHPALEGYWRFEGDLQDTEGTVHGQTVEGEPAFVPGPAGGKALSVDRGRLVTLGAAPSLDLPETTIELWFKPTFEPGSRPNPCLVAKRAVSKNTRFSIHLWRDYSCIATWNGSQVVRYRSLGYALKPGQWFHLAVTAKGSDVRVYLDGLECRREGPKAGFTLDATEHPLRIGWPEPDSGEVFAGAMDELAIYKAALPVEEIERHVDALGIKERVTREEIAARLEKERREREQRNKERLAELTDEDVLFGRGETTVYKGEHLGAVRLAVGGIGAGSVIIDGKAARPAWHIFNNVPAVAVPHSFFAVRAQAQGAEPVLRALQTDAVGPFSAMGGLTFRGEYPFGWFDFQDDALPVQVRLETFNPLIPLAVRSSAIPCAIYAFTVKNPSDQPAEVSLLGTQQNTVGFTLEGSSHINGRAHPAYGRNTNRVLRQGDAAVLQMRAEKPHDAPGFGSMALAALDKAATGTASWTTLEALAEDIAPDGLLTGLPDAPPSEKGTTLDGALAVPFALQPGESRTVTFILAWHFPNARHGHRDWGGEGNMYANWWPNATAVVREVADRLDELTEKTRRYHDTLYASNLPRWLLDRISSQLVVIRCPTTFWTKSGYFGGWEGCSRGSGCCYGNCNHVWHYAQAHARVFPAIARRMREQELRFMTDDGAIPHRQPRSHPAFDGQCGGILGAWREHLMSPDGAWLAEHWPRVKKAMDHLIAHWDEDGDGVLHGPQWNTLDGNLGGSTSWLGTLYLAALEASERMALLQGDPDTAERYRTIRQAGEKKQDATLFNGEYYIQLPDPKPQQDYGTGCHIDQVLGQWWAHQLDLGWLYPPDHVRSALGALFQHNFQPTFHGIHQAPRKFVADDDPGMQMITWPGDDRPAKHMRYADEVMSGFEYSAAAAMVQAGLLREGFAIVHAAWIRYDGRRRDGLHFSGGWGTSGNPFGDDECGRYYARPMSIWSMLLACQGAVYDGPAGRIGFRPVWQPADHASFFTAAEGWGLFTQRRGDGEQTDRIELRYGTLGIRELVFELPEGAEEPKVVVRCSEENVPATLAQDGSRVTVALSRLTRLQEGQALTATFTW